MIFARFSAGATAKISRITALTSSIAVKAVPPDGGMDMRYVPPIVSGLKEPRCVRFAPGTRTMFVCDMSACCVWRIEFD